MIVGCDYSTKAIHVAWKDTKWHALFCPVDDDLAGFLKAVEIMLPDGGTDLYLERPWARYNVQTGMQMQRMATIVDVIATQKGYETHWVAIQSWRSKILGKGKWTTKIAKAASIAKALELTGKELDDNNADAVCLAQYGMKVVDD